MKAAKIKLAMLFALLAVHIAFAGDSAPILLDTMDGTRIARASERIAYSTEWNGGSSVRVAADGSTLKTASAPASGEIVWNTTASGVGGHVLTHVCGGETLTAHFAVLGDDVGVVSGGRLAASATWSADKTWLVTQPLTIPSGVTLTIEKGAVVKFMPGASLTIASGGLCYAYGAVFTHVNDDTIGGDTLFDGDAAQPVMGDYAITGSVYDDDDTEYRYMPPQTLTGSISYDTRLRGYRTYIASNTVTVASGATLTLQPGTVIKFAPGCSMTVNGTLDAQGARAAPIVFTSLKDDEHGGDSNGDGDKTYAQPGDWARIYAGGTLNMNHCIIRHCNNTSDQGAIQGTGGTVTFDNGLIESSVYECVRMNSGSFTAHNSVFRDASMGFGYYGGSGVHVYNCVVADCTIGCRASNKHFYNTVFYRCQTFLESTSSSCSHCVFYNPPGYGAQSAAQVGSNGNIWGDPQFADPDNGDFTIAATSPCVDAGDGTVSPEFDYWGRPRMDVKTVADTGRPNMDGVCPDIGIYEVDGAATMPLPDLAVLGVEVRRASGASYCGDELTVSYVVTNRGAAATTGIVRDMIRFRGADAVTGGLTVDAAEIEKTYNIAAGEAATFESAVKVPALKAGAWKVGVAVNQYNHPYEQSLANNTAWAEGTFEVELEAMSLGSCSVTVAKGEASGFVLSGLPVSGGVVRVTGGGAISAYGGNGALPTVGGTSSCSTVSIGDGSILVVFPSRPEGESAYLLLANEGDATAAVTVEVKERELALYGVSPSRVANTGDATITITGSGISAAVSMKLGGRAAKKVETLNAAQVARRRSTWTAWRRGAMPSPQTAVRRAARPPSSRMPWKSILRRRGRSCARGLRCRRPCATGGFARATCAMRTRAIPR